MGASAVQTDPDAETQGDPTLEPMSVQEEEIVVRTPDPVQGKIYLIDGQAHLIADRNEITSGIEGCDSSGWISLTRVNGSSIVVAKSAVVAYE